MVSLGEGFVEFRFFRPDAQQVHLTGDFNEWDHAQTPMARDGEGYWQVHLALPPGEFKFRYYADGQWFTDFAAFGVEPGPYGPDSVVRVPHPPLTVARPAQVRTVAAA
jgi:1,4-alpha-glucan branching enzyme